MDFAPRGRRAPEESLSLGSVMRPLSKLRALVSVTVEVRGLLDTSTDADMIVLAEAFPLLTTLQIHCRPLLAVPSLSAAVLASFASRCPKLETLSLPSMHVVERDLSRLANYPALDYGLRSLHFSTLDSADGHFTALLLDRLFPRMEITGFRPKPSLDEPSSSQRTWARICDILETLRIARRQHERRQSVVSWSIVPQLELDVVMVIDMQVSGLNHSLNLRAITERLLPPRHAPPTNLSTTCDLSPLPQEQRQVPDILQRGLSLRNLRTSNRGVGTWNWSKTHHCYYRYGSEGNQYNTGTRERVCKDIEGPSSTSWM